MCSVPVPAAQSGAPSPEAGFWLGKFGVGIGMGTAPGGWN